MRNMKPIKTRNTGLTYVARTIEKRAGRTTKPALQCSCTAGAEGAAQALAQKWYGNQARGRVIDSDDRDSLIADGYSLRQTQEATNVIEW